MPVGGFRHGIMCDEQGRIMMDGVVMRIAQDEFYTCWLAPLHRLRAVQGLLRRGGRGPDGQALPVPGGGAQVPGDPGACRGRGPARHRVRPSPHGDHRRRRGAGVPVGHGRIAGLRGPRRRRRRAERLQHHLGGGPGPGPARSWARSPTCSTTPRTASRRPTTTSPTPGTRTPASRPTWTPVPARAG